MTAFLRTYVAVVAVLGLGLLAVALWQGSGAVPGPTYWVLAAFLLGAELLPLHRRHGGQRESIDYSTPFLLTLLVEFGLGPAIAAQTVASVVVGVLGRQPWWKIAFNASQYSLSVGAAALALWVAGGEAPQLAHIGGVVVIALAGAMFVATNRVLLRVAIAHATGRRFVDLVLADLAFQLVAELGMLAYTPIILLIAQRVPDLLGLAVTPMVALHWSSSLLLQKQQQEERFREMLRNSNDVIARVDAAGRFQEASSSSLRVLGAGAEELATTRLIDRFHPDDVQRVDGCLAALIADPAQPVTFDARWRMPDGSYRHLEALCSNHIADNRLQGIIVNARDISDRVRLRDQLIQADRMQTLGLLSGGLAHDFNNLLGVISMTGELLRDSLPPGDGRHEDVEAMIEACSRAARLTRQLMAFGRDEPTGAEPLAIDRTLDGLRKLVSRTLGPGVTLDLDLGAGSACVGLSESRLEQILFNLVVNARHAMPAGGTLSIRTHAMQTLPLAAPGAGTGAPAGAARTVILSVSDTGCGMDAPTLARLFEPFFTTRKPGHGTGLGLASVHRIIQQAGGTIDVQSTPGRGTRFDVYLPCVARSARSTGRIEDPGRRHAVAG